MDHVALSTRQPQREAWSRERLLHERAIALGNALDPNTMRTYDSALQSYLTFCKLHDMPIVPTADTLSFYVVFMCHHIKPNSVSSYLSGICSHLEPYYETVHTTRNSKLVCQTLAGCRKLYNTPVNRKRPLMVDDLLLLEVHLLPSPDPDDLLFLCLVFTGTLALMRLGELVWPDRVADRSSRKLILRHTVSWHPGGYGFVLPTHKADREFQGSDVVVKSFVPSLEPRGMFHLENTM